MHSAAQAYSRTARIGLTTRQLEAELLSQCARDLEAAAGPDSTDEQVLDAVGRNRRLWSELAMNLRDPENPLPSAMKDSMNELARFVFARTHRVCETMDRALLAPLARINRQIAAGLRGEALPQGPGR